jgi:hypothetical protein
LGELKAQYRDLVENAQVEMTGNMFLTVKALPVQVQQKPVLEENSLGSEHERLYLVTDFSVNKDIKQLRPTLSVVVYFQSNSS